MYLKVVNRGEEGQVIISQVLLCSLHMHCGCFGHGWTDRQVLIVLSTLLKHSKKLITLANLINLLLLPRPSQISHLLPICHLGLLLILRAGWEEVSSEALCVPVPT